MRLRGFLIFLCLLCNFIPASAQTYTVGSSLDDYLRRSQLTRNLDSNISFTVRPLKAFTGSNSRLAYFPDETEGFVPGKNGFSSPDGKIKGMFLPLDVRLQGNSDHPYGWNDGAMIPAKGLQVMVSPGIFAEYGPLSIQLKPEIVLADNADFETFDKDHYDVIFARFYDFYNQIDAPVRFGSKGYSKIFLGQSSIRLNYKGFSIGGSTENLWWGPGIKNSLTMSNNAPGFAHLTINTTKPAKTAIGSFEGQLIGGRLEGSGFGPLEPNKDYFNSPLYIPKTDDWRWISGIVLTWQPKWIRGLFLGITSTAQLYSKDIDGFGSLVPIYSNYEKVTADDPIDKRDKHSSVFMRWLWPEEEAEVYFEFGHSNIKRTARQAILQPDRNRGYIFGLRKMLDFNVAKEEKLLISAEVAQLQQTQLSDVLATKSWYLNPHVRHGYTNEGQVLGAGIGPGANFQSLDVSWIKGLKRLGLSFERYLHNNDFYFYSYIDSQDPRRHWTDLSLAASGEWNYQNFVFNAKLMATKSINYQWYLLQDPASQEYFVNGRDAFNIQLKAGFSYRF